MKASVTRRRRGMSRPAVTAGLLEARQGLGEMPVKEGEDRGGDRQGRQGDRVK